MQKNPQYINNEIKKMLTEGKKDEIKVGEMLTQQCGGNFELSTMYEDIHKHIDIWWYSPKKGKLGIDVKGIRKNKRNDKDVDDSIHWIELKNTQGNDGWIFGQMDYIAFMTKSEVLFVKPHKLQKLILQNIVGKNIVYINNNLPNYQPYQRKDRKDIIIKISTDDLRLITHFKIKNNI